MEGSGSSLSNSEKRGRRSFKKDDGRESVEKIRCFYETMITSKGFINEENLKQIKDLGQYGTSLCLKVHRFLMKLLCEEQYLEALSKQIKDKTTTKKECSIRTIDKHLEKQSYTSLENLISLKEMIPSSKNKRRSMTKKLSILCDGSFGSFDSGPLITEISLKKFSSFRTSDIELSTELINQIFDGPDPFMMNMSLCLVVKFLTFSQLLPNQENIVWILCIASMIASKVQNDITVEGTLERYAKILRVTTVDIKDLEFYFLEQIHFHALVNRHQFDAILSRILML